MRRTVLLASILWLLSAGAAQAAPPVPIVTGGYSYEYLSHVSTVDVVGRAGDPARGWFSYTGAFATFGGPVTCVRVLGADAWLAGPITHGDAGIEGVAAGAIRILDGGSPGRDGEAALTVVDAAQSAIAFCESATTEMDPYLQPVIDGNLTVHQAG
jgi:hypothetical protein